MWDGVFTDVVLGSGNESDGRDDYLMCYCVDGDDVEDVDVIMKREIINRKRVLLTITTPLTTATSHKKL